VDPQTGNHNLAPYSQFNNLTYDPPYVMFSANQHPTGVNKDSVNNAEVAGCFGWSLATWDLREQVNVTAEFVPPEVDEFERAGLEKVWSQVLPVKTPLVQRSPVRFECVYHSTIKLPGNPPMGTVSIVIGRVVAVHVEDWALTDGKIDIRKTKPIARCGYYEYAVVENTFEMIIPGMNEAVLAGLEGSSRRTKAALGDGTKAERDKYKPQSVNTEVQPSSSVEELNVSENNVSEEDSAAVAILASVTEHI